MAEDEKKAPAKKAKWPISERAADIEAARGYSKTQADKFDNKRKRLKRNG